MSDNFIGLSHLTKFDAVSFENMFIFLLFPKQVDHNAIKLI
jgi:hypothetical protein